MSDSEDDELAAIFWRKPKKHQFIYSDLQTLLLDTGISIAASVASGIAGVREHHVRPASYVENVIPYMSDTDFYSLYRMCPSSFRNLMKEINEIYPSLEKDYVGGNYVITAEKKLLITLTYLGTQISYLRIGELFNVAQSSACNIVHECVLQIIQLQNKYIRWPSNTECELIAEKFERVANFPNVIGAIDGSHITVKAPACQQDSYTNRKMGKSIILQGVCTSDKILTNVCIGMPGCAHDARVLTSSNLFKITSEQGQSTLFYDKYHLLGDSAYPLKQWLITPFRAYGNLTRRKRKFNYVLSKTRCAIENTFGLLKGRWRRLQYIDVHKVEFATDIVMACCVLQNFCLLNNDNLEEPFHDDDKQQEEGLHEEDGTNAGATLKREQILQSMQL